MENAVLHEYLVVIPPSDEVIADTIEMKAHFKRDYNLKSPLKSKPHITLTNFVQPQFVEEKLLNNYLRLATSISSFEVSLSGFGHFPGLTNTIYVKIKNEQQISKISKNIRKFSKNILKTTINHKVHYATKPHLTIAKGMSESDFTKAWPNWKNKDYAAIFNASSIIVLRRKISKVWEKYEVIGDFPFLGAGPLEYQLKLF